MSDDKIKCSFCLRTKEDGIKVMIRSTMKRDKTICNECVDDCKKLIEPVAQDSDGAA